MGAPRIPEGGSGDLCGSGPRTLTTEKDPFLETKNVPRMATGDTNVQHGV